MKIGEFIKTNFNHNHLNFVVEDAYGSTTTFVKRGSSPVNCNQILKECVIKRWMIDVRTSTIYIGI